MARTLDRAFGVTEGGAPEFAPTNGLAGRICENADNVVLVHGWEADDGENLSVLVLRDGAGMMVGALPVPPDDDRWLDLFERSPELAVDFGRGATKTLRILAG